MDLLLDYKVVKSSLHAVQNVAYLLGVEVGTYAGEDYVVGTEGMETLVAQIHDLDDISNRYKDHFGEVSAVLSNVFDNTVLAAKTSGDAVKVEE